MTARIENLAAVVLAHTDHAHLRRLVDALPGCPVFVHWDVKSSEGETKRARQLADIERVEFLPARDVRLASWSLVATELDALRRVLDTTDVEHIAIMSGADFPIAAPEIINEALASWRGTTWVRNIALPYPSWNAPLLNDGGMWRMRWWFPTRNDQTLTWRGHPLFVPARRHVPEQLSLRASPQWKIYARHDAARLLQVLDDNPELVRFGQRIYIPEESLVTSVMASHELFGDAALLPQRHGPWYVSWPRGARRHHPNLMDEHDIELARDRMAHPETEGEPADHWIGPIFARKFSSANAEIADRIESELWSRTVR